MNMQLLLNNLIRRIQLEYVHISLMDCCMDHNIKQKWCNLETVDYYQNYACLVHLASDECMVEDKQVFRDAYRMWTSVLDECAFVPD